jgi:hypothetical protein
VCRGAMHVVRVEEEECASGSQGWARLPLHFWEFSNDFIQPSLHPVGDSTYQLR